VVSGRSCGKNHARSKRCLTPFPSVVFAQRAGAEMHIAIDDTYGPETDTNSEYVTGRRRTHLAVAIPSKDAVEVRKSIKDLLKTMSDQFNTKFTEFHFTDIYNRKKPWRDLPEGENLKIIEAFALLYKSYRWKVFLQTVDDRTLTKNQADDFAKIKDNSKEFDLSKREDVSLVMLLVTVRNFFATTKEPLLVVADEGRGKPGKKFAAKFFRSYPAPFDGRYQSSRIEPLLQVADFLAFSINRTTYLATKAQRSEVDTWFLNLVGTMDINCDDILKTTLTKDFTVKEFDAIHKEDRFRKGLER
jgi:hypothetical protein